MTEIDLGFVILVLRENPVEIRLTKSRILNVLPKASIRIATSPELEKKCNFGLPIDVGEKTITNLINIGVEKSDKDWNMILVAGTNFTKNLLKKYIFFCKNEKDFLYSVVNRKWVFSDASINGIMFNRKEIPRAPVDEPDISFVKVVWASEILRFGGNLKAIIPASPY